MKQSEILTSRLFPPGRDSSPDWIEDNTHENGNYLCQCVHCKRVFVGHKRRVVCKVCDEREVKR
jgi:hypothetical protein